MNKKEIIEQIAESTGLSRTDAGRALDAVIDSITNSLSRGDSVSIPGFGTFLVRERPARKGRNPQTGAEIDLPAANIAAFRPSTKLKTVIDNSDTSEGSSTTTKPPPRKI